MPDFPDAFDWKSGSMLAGLAIASMGVARKVMTPFLVKQVREAVGEPLAKISDQLLAIQIEQDSAREVAGKLNERVSFIEGLIEQGAFVDRRRKPRA